jgi:hypothetical protein
MNTEKQNPTLEDVIAFYKAWILAMHTRQFQGETLYKGWGRLKISSVTAGIGYCCLGVGLKVGIELFSQFMNLSEAKHNLLHEASWTKCHASGIWELAGYPPPSTRWPVALRAIQGLIRENDAEGNRGPNAQWPIEAIIDSLVPASLRGELQQYYRKLKQEELLTA